MCAPPAISGMMQLVLLLRPQATPRGVSSEEKEVKSNALHFQAFSIMELTFVFSVKVRV